MRLTSWWKLLARNASISLLLDQGNQVDPNNVWLYSRLVRLSWSDLFWMWWKHVNFGVLLFPPEHVLGSSPRSKYATTSLADQMETMPIQRLRSYWTHWRVPLFPYHDTIDSSILSLHGQCASVSTFILWSSWFISFLKEGDERVRAKTMKEVTSSKAALFAHAWLSFDCCVGNLSSTGILRVCFRSFCVKRLSWLLFSQDRTPPHGNPWSTPAKVTFLCVFVNTTWSVVRKIVKSAPCEVSRGNTSVLFACLSRGRGTSLSLLKYLNNQYVLALLHTRMSLCSFSCHYQEIINRFCSSLIKWKNE